MKALLFLFFSINLINYFDRGLISSFNNNFINDFNISKTESGIINSSFIIGYILLSPLFSYLVYKYNKINLIFTGLVIWSISNLCAFFSSSNYYFFDCKSFCWSWRSFIWNNCTSDNRYYVRSKKKIY